MQFLAISNSKDSLKWKKRKEFVNWRLGKNMSDCLQLKFLTHSFTNSTRSTALRRKRSKKVIASLSCYHWRKVTQAQAAPTKLPTQKHCIGLSGVRTQLLRQLILLTLRKLLLILHSVNMLRSAYRILD